MVLMKQLPENQYIYFRCLKVHKRKNIKHNAVWELLVQSALYALSSVLKSPKVSLE